MYSAIASSVFGAISRPTRLTMSSISGQLVDKPDMLAPDHQIRMAVQNAREHGAAAAIQCKEKHRT